MQARRVECPRQGEPPVGLQPYGRRGSQAQAPHRRREVLSAKVVPRQKERDARFPGGPGRLDPDRLERLFRLGPLARLEQIGRARERGVEVRPWRLRADIAVDGNARENSQRCDNDESGDRVIK